MWSWCSRYMWYDPIAVLALWVRLPRPKVCSCTSWANARFNFHVPHSSSCIIQDAFYPLSGSGQGEMVRVLPPGTGRMPLLRLRHHLVTPNQTLTPVSLPRKRSKSTVALALLLAFFILVTLYYMIFVITVPCGTSLGGHWTIWQMITGGTCR